MITTNVNLDFAGILNLGYQGENDARSFAFDFSEWMKHFQTGGNVRLLALRPGETVCYPCVITVSDTTATWTVKLSDVEIPGNGAVELQYAVGDAVVKAKRFRTSVGTSIAESSGDVPEPASPWVNEVLDAARRAEEAADRAGVSGGGEIPAGGGTSFKTDETLTLENGILSVNTAKEPDPDNTLPITSAAVAATVGNIEVLLKTI